MKNNKGITLIALVLTIIILLILASVATYSGIQSIQSSKVTLFATEMKIMQVQVNKMYKDKEEYINKGKTLTGTDGDYGFSNIKTEIGADLEENGYSFELDDYRYFTANSIKSDLQVEGVERDLFIDFNNRRIISREGVKYNGTICYIMEELPDSLYNIAYEQDTNKPDFDLTCQEVEKGLKWEIKIENIEQDNNISKWSVLYKKATDVNWKKSETTTITVTEEGTYEVQIYNGDIVSDVESIIVESLAQRVYTDVNGDEALIPENFRVSSVEAEQTIDTGLVIIAPDTSEFVWVPIDKTTLFADGVEGKSIAKLTSGQDSTGLNNYQGVLYDFTGTSSNILTSTNYAEPKFLSDSFVDGGSYNTVGITAEVLQNEYNKFIAGVRSNGGFYVGRYETSLDRTQNLFQSLKNKSSVTGNTNTYRWYGLYKNSKLYATKIDSAKIVSSMMYDSAYDAMLNWMLNGAEKDKVTSTTIGTHEKSNLKYTGTTSTDIINNIYDLGGNYFEWTLGGDRESYRIDRNGFNTNASPSYRGSSPGVNADGNMGVRMLLYISN